MSKLNIIGGCKNIANGMIEHMKCHSVLLSISILHLTLMLYMIPYVVKTELCTDYILTFPTTPFYNHLTLVLGIILSISLVVWFYHYYLPYVWLRYSCGMKMWFLFVIFFYVVYIIFSYPQMLLLDGDYTALYDMASHGRPLFWHGYLTSVFYLGYYLVFFHPISIIIIETLLFVVIFAHILEIAFSYIPEHRGGWRFVVYSSSFVLLVMLARINTMAFIPHRVHLWGAFAVYHVVEVLCHIFKKDLTFLGSPCFYLHSVLAGILGFWRTEGVLFLVWMHLSFLFMALINARKMSVSFFELLNKLKPAATGMALSFSVCVLAYIPQLSVNLQYYGSDYMLVNYVGSVGEMLFDENIDLSYDGASDDISCINSFTPLFLIQKFGSGAYTYHYVSERMSGNCTISGLSEAEKIAYMNSVRNIVYHNPAVFIKSRIILYLQTNGYLVGEPGGAEYYKEYLKGYGDYYYDVGDRLKEIGFHPIFFISMVKQVINRVKATFFCPELFVLLLLLTEIIFVSLQIGNYVYLKLIALSHMTIQFVVDGVKNMALYVFMPMGGMLAFFIYLMFMSYVGRAYSLLQLFIETSLLILGIVMCILDFIRKDYLISCTYLFLYICLVPILIFAPISYWIYYTGMYSCIFAVTGLDVIRKFSRKFLAG